MSNLRIVGPDENKNIERVNEIYHHKGRSLFDLLRLNTEWDRIDLGNEGCVQ